jgi:hypothetical protein
VRKRISDDLVGSIGLEPLCGNVEQFPPIAEPVQPEHIELLVERPLDRRPVAGPKGGREFVPVFSRSEERKIAGSIARIEPLAGDNLDEKISGSKRKRIQLKPVASFGGTRIITPPQSAVAALFSLSDHPKPATDYHLKTGQRE